MVSKIPSVSALEIVFVARNNGGKASALGVAKSTTIWAGDAVVRARMVMGAVTRVHNE